jgi:peptidoglycan-associated lipoprotein
MKADAISRRLLMRRVITLAVPLFALALAGCPGKKPTGGACQSDKDCAAQQGFGKVCVQGRCQECAADPDCPAGFSCRDNKCMPRAECDETRPCPGGQACQAGRCVAPEGPTSGGAGAGGAGAVAAPTCRLGAVSFEFNEATLGAAARDVLAQDAECLKSMKARKVTVEGHCDERGTNEYNQHLGQRRAEAVRRYLTNLGVDGASLDVVSYGEEQPVCTEATEACWARNRRAELRAQ